MLTLNQGIRETLIESSYYCIVSFMLSVALMKPFSGKHKCHAPSLPSEPLAWLTVERKTNIYAEALTKYTFKSL